MKLITAVLFAMLSFVLLSVTTFAGQAPAANDQSDVQAAVNNYIKSIDTRNSSGLEKVLYDNASIVTYNKITNKVEHYTANQFLDMLKNGKKGGWTRNVNINSVDVSGNTAMAKVNITDSRLNQSGYFSLIKTDGGWKVASEVTTLELNK